MISNIATVKQHLRVDSNAEDALISIYMQAAEDYIKNYIDAEIPLVPEPEDYVGDPWPVTVFPSVVAAFLLLVGDLYENRQAQGEVDLSRNMTVQYLLYPYRKNMGV